MSLWKVVLVFISSYLTTLLVKLLMKYRRISHYVDKLPGPPRAWLPIGNALMLKSDHTSFFQQIRNFYEEYRLHGRGCYRLWIGPFPYVIIFKGVLAEAVLSSYKFLEKGPDYDLIRPWLGNGLLTSTGDYWRARRKFLTPAFHFQILNEFLEVFYEQSKILTDCLAENAATGREVEVSSFVSRCTLDIICETAMGKKIHAQTKADSSYVSAVYRMSELIYTRVLNPFLHPPFLNKIFGRQREWDETLKTLHNFTKAVISERQLESLASGGPTKKRKAFLDLLLNARTEDGGLLDDGSIQEEVDTFMFEGHDTTSAAASFALFLLGCHPDVQQKVYDEQVEIFGKSNRAPTADDLKKMQYLDLVIKETLRLYPSVPMITRKCLEDFDIPETDIKIPKGCIVSIFILSMQRDPDIFPEPDKFNPDRFLDSESSRQGPFDYVPFSAGPRNCIGQKFAIMEEKTILSTVLRKYAIESIDNLDSLKITGELITRPVDGIHVKLLLR